MLLRPRGDYSRDDGGDARRAEAFQHADAFVPLLHVEAPHVLAAAYRVADALVAEVRLAQAYPLMRKFRLLAEQRHEVCRKGVLPAAGLCADDVLGRAIYRAKLNSARSHRLVEYLVEHLRVRVLPLYQAFLAAFLPGLQGYRILLCCFLSAHGRSPSRRRNAYSGALVLLLFSPKRKRDFPPRGARQENLPPIHFLTIA